MLNLVDISNEITVLYFLDTSAYVTVGEQVLCK